ncbi:MAG: tyrosine-type recombinase/integrase [Gammaproteobacteria bacterium]|nr:tyrosine-type recombinase/integrase [Gammaproteobacteria bacterium]
MRSASILDVKPNPNHPKSGDTIKVEPIRTVNAINKLKQHLAPSPRNYALFVVGINTAYRASELLSIRIGRVRHLQPGDRLEVKQRKTNKYRAVTLNSASYRAIQNLLEHLDHMALKSKNLAWVDDDAFLFAGRKPDQAIRVPTLNNLVKDWCRSIKLKGNYGSHSLRKTWGYMQRTKQNTPIPLLMQAFGHASQQQTLSYLCIQDEEIESIYTSLEL